LGSRVVVSFPGEKISGYLKGWAQEWWKIAGKMLERVPNSSKGKNTGTRENHPILPIKKVKEPNN